MKSLICVLLFGLATIANAGEVSYQDCGGKETLRIEVEGCSGWSCPVKRGQTVRVKASFRAVEDTHTVLLKLFAKFKGKTVGLREFNVDACKGHSLKCPIRKGSDNQFTYDVTIPKDAPEMKGKIEAQLIGSSGAMMACVFVQGQITA